MVKPKLFDCITFFDENFITNVRFEILNDIVDYFIVCESKYDHMGNSKSINFSLKNKKFKDKVRHIIIEEQFPNFQNGWKNEEYQREKIFDGIKDATSNDYILFSDSDEIPNPEKLLNLKLKKKFAIFLQIFYVYKINIYNRYETPWEGTRVCKKKDLKSFTYLRKKILKKNISKPFWKINYEKNIELFENGGWHFNNLYKLELIKKKIETFPHDEFKGKKFTEIKNIQKRVENLEDLFGRGHKYEKVNLNNTYPKYITENLDLFKEYIL